ncbi:acyl-CoA carboxylase epsilon subunit-like protein [Murinocardiopsis flavida]|uniref:Acyl-CoA carboxylase epsilon subunit-like protein n=1 Tax=Murinocardiopsis flavida TaxID=645275 RepID=A0A2P8DIP6_9ACTN|nr:acyl-CoA carboxylase subunit epsilon [Murinocardiopsis flavida]PSK97029.1 acyl-CoA carboxylase epsilon subunit-like protein [Murinocardiopsis flavida]
MSGTEGPGGSDVGGGAPFLRVVRGEPTADEVAALVAVLAARARAARAGRGGGAHAPRSAWRDRARLVRAPLRPGPGAWRMSTR